MTITCNSFQYEHINSNMIDREIIAYANSFFFEDFNLQIILDHEEIVEEEFIPQIDVDLTDTSQPSYKFVKIDELQNFIGEVNGAPIDISTIKSSLENIEVAGQLKFLNEKSFESKRKDKEGNALIRKY